MSDPLRGPHGSSPPGPSGTPPSGEAGAPPPPGVEPSTAPPPRTSTGESLPAGASTSGQTGAAAAPGTGPSAAADSPADAPAPPTASVPTGDPAGDPAGDDTAPAASPPGGSAGRPGAPDGTEAAPPSGAPDEHRTAVVEAPSAAEPVGSGASRAAGRSTRAPGAEDPTAVLGPSSGAEPVGSGASRATDRSAREPGAEDPTVALGAADRTASGGPAGLAAPAGPGPAGAGGEERTAFGGGVGGGGGDVPPSAPPGPPGGTPPPPPYAPIRGLRRSRDRKVIAGVAGGLGEYTGVDPVLFRVLFAVLSVFGGAGILLYLLGWLFLPAADEPTSPVESLLGRGSGRRTGDVVQAALLVLAGLILAGVLAGGDGGDVFLLLVVIAGIVLLVRNLDERRDRRPPAPPPAAPPPAAYQPYEPAPYPYPYDPARTAAMPAGPPTATVVEPPPVPPPPVKEPKERSILGRLTLSALLVVLGVTAALDAGGAIEPQARHYLALAVGVLGIGLVVGAWRGRARGLVWLGLPLTVALVAVSTAEVSLEGGAGDRQYRPQSVAEVQDEYRVGVGNLQLDLTGVDFTGRSVVTSASAGLGNVEVRVPRDVDVEVVARAGIGEADLFDERVNGGSQRTVVDTGPDGEGGGSLRLTLEVGGGRVEVDRASA
jgi:phage shock protein PspC (stress-responsive transcriptional regulator)